MRLEEVHERESFVKTTLQTLDLRLAQLEELSGRMARALESLAGTHGPELMHTRPRAASECEATFLLRQGSVHSADSGGGFRFHFPAEELGEASPPRTLAPGFGGKKACSFRGKGEGDPQRHLVPGRQGSLRLSPGRSAPATPGGSRLGLDNIQDPWEPKSGPEIGVPAGGDSEREREETRSPSVAPSESALPNAQPMAGPARVEGAAPGPPGGTRRPRCDPDRATDACPAVESTSFVCAHGRRLVGGVGQWGAEHGSVLDQVWTTEWQCQVQKVTRSRSTDIPAHVVSEAARRAERGEQWTDTQEAPWPPRLSLAVTRRAEQGGLLAVKADQALGVPPSRSKSLHGRPGRAADAPGHAGSVGSLVAPPGRETGAKPEKTPAETAC